MRILVSIALIALALCACRGQSPSEPLDSDLASASIGTKPVIVLVHGALFTKEGWGPLHRQLMYSGYNVVTLDLPGRKNDGIDPKSITIDVAAQKVCRAIKLEKGPLILVGHSQGGAVITQAASDCGANVKALVYVSAVVPKNGEIAFAGLNPARDKTFPLCVDPDPAAGLFKLKRSGPLESSFFQDLRAIDPELADQALAGMVSEPMGIGTTPLHLDVLKINRIRKFYVEATLDRVVSIETQRSFQKGWTFSKVYSHATGHSGFLSQPRAIADDLVDVTKIINQ